jgi:hypothetical protein
MTYFDSIREFLNNEPKDGIIYVVRIPQDHIVVLGQRFDFQVAIRGRDEKILGLFQTQENAELFASAIELTALYRETMRSQS